MFHPVLIITVRVIFEGVGTARLLARVGGVHGG
jgi:hypothetical protein